MYPISDLARQRVDELRQAADELHQGRAPRVPDLEPEATPIVAAPRVVAAVPARPSRTSGCSPTPTIATSHR